MIGENGTPETPGWELRIINTGCDNCTMSANFCGCNTAINGARCCTRCSHLVGVETEPVTWHGDDN